MKQRFAIAMAALLVVPTCWSSDGLCGNSHFEDLIHQGRQLEASESFLAAEAPYRQAYEFASTSNLVSSIEKIEAHYRLANVYVLQNKFKHAEKYYQALIAMIEEDKKVKRVDREAMVFLEDLADAYCHSIKGKHEVEAIKHAIKLRDYVSGDNNDFMIGNLRKLTMLLMSQNRLQEAEPYMERAVRISAKFKGNDRFGHGGDLVGLSMIQYRLDKIDKAEMNARAALALAKRLEVPPKEINTRCLVLLGQILVKQKQIKAAEDSLLQAKAIMKRNPKAADLQTRLYSMMLDSEIDTAKGKSANAIATLNEVMAILEKKFGKDSTLLIRPLKELERIYEKRKDTKNARAVSERIESIKKGNNRSGFMF